MELLVPRFGTIWNWKGFPTNCFHGCPYFFIINREGVIVNYGSMMRPSYPGTAECIEEWLE